MTHHTHHTNTHTHTHARTHTHTQALRSSQTRQCMHMCSKTQSGTRWLDCPTDSDTLQTGIEANPTDNYLTSQQNRHRHLSERTLSLLLTRCGAVEC